MRQRRSPTSARATKRPKADRQQRRRRRRPGPGVCVGPVWRHAHRRANVTATLDSFKVLTFDCYGTLIDWETGIYAALGPLLKMGDVTLSRNVVLETFAKKESAQQAATPEMPYSALLAEVHAPTRRSFGGRCDRCSAPTIRRVNSGLARFPRLCPVARIFIGSLRAGDSLERRRRELQRQQSSSQGYVRRHIYCAGYRLLQTCPSKFRLLCLSGSQRGASSGTTSST